jgi:hypothetical protein
MLCHEPVDTSRAPYVYWMGGDADMVLHVNCTVPFALALARDAWDLKDRGMIDHVYGPDVAQHP